MMLNELQKVTTDMGNPSGSEISAQDEATMRLKPNKYFKRVKYHSISPLVITAGLVVRHSTSDS